MIRLIIIPTDLPPTNLPTYLLTYDLPMTFTFKNRPFKNQL
jgi:hypothetical protein